MWNKNNQTNTKSLSFSKKTQKELAYKDNFNEYEITLLWGVAYYQAWQPFPGT